MNKKEIRRKISLLQAEVKKFYDDADDLRRKYINENWDVIRSKHKEIDVLKNSLKNLNEKTKLEIPDHIRFWFVNYKAGMDFGHGGLHIIYVSPKQHYVIITNKGGVTSTGSFWNPFYAPAEHWFVKVGSPRWREQTPSEVVNGRLSKEKKQEWINKIIELENKEGDK